MVVAWLDYTQKYDQGKLAKVDKSFLIIFNIQNLCTIILYVTLFIMFKVLIRDKKDEQPELNALTSHINRFFTFMICLQIVFMVISFFFVLE